MVQFALSAPSEKYIKRPIMPFMLSAFSSSEIFSLLT